MNSVLAFWQGRKKSAVKNLYNNFRHSMGQAVALLLLSPMVLVMADTIKLHPIGDSTTYGYKTEYCWRYYFYKLLTVNGCDSVDLVGSAHGPTAGTVDEFWDRDHDGHSSWMTSNFLGDGGKGTVREWAFEYTPHIAVLYLGTNDIRDGRTTADIIESLEAIITVLRNARNEVKIVLCQIPNWNYEQRGGQQWAVDELNASILLLAKLGTGTSPVVIADLNSNYTIADHNDGIHPGITGAPKIANRIFDAIKPWLEGGQVYTMQRPLQQPGRSSATKTVRLSLYTGGPPTIWIAPFSAVTTSPMRGWLIDGRVLR